MAVINAPFQSQYGFKGPGFSVDEFGNIVAASIVTNAVVDQNDIVDYVITESGNEFLFAGNVTANPTLTLSRSKTYKFSLTLPTLGFKIYNSDQTSLYNVGLTHSDRSTGADAQGKVDGILAFSVAINTPDILYYGNDNGTSFGIINIVDPIGVFSTLDVNATTASTSSTTGALTVAGGVGIQGDLYLAGSLNIDGIGIQSISSPTNLDIEAANNIVIKIDGSTLGIVDSTGSSIPIVNTTINNTAIGATVPASASFTSATVVNLPTTDIGVTNKQYVDSTALSLAIAFGL